MIFKLARGAQSDGWLSDKFSSIFQVVRGGKRIYRPTALNHMKFCGWRLKKS